jgi:hypothetical protein
VPDIRRICRHLAKTLDPNEQGGIAIQKASVKDKIITFESSLLQVFGCGSIKMLPLKSKKWGQRATSSAVHLCCKRNTSK